MFIQQTGPASHVFLYKDGHGETPRLAPMVNPGNQRIFNVHVKKYQKVNMDINFRRASAIRMVQKAQKSPENAFFRHKNGCRPIDTCVSSY